MMRRVAAVVPDLFFAARIEATARAVGVELALLGPRQALDRITADPPALVLLDLHAEGDPVALVQALKADARTAAVPVVAFGSHVETERLRAVRAAGAEHALARSAFTTLLPELLRGELPGQGAP
jgi:CheY-like chemotaxis protein